MLALKSPSNYSSGSFRDFQLIGGILIRSCQFSTFNSMSRAKNSTSVLLTKTSKKRTSRRKTVKNGQEIDPFKKTKNGLKTNEKRPKSFRNQKSFPYLIACQEQKNFQHLFC